MYGNFLIKRVGVGSAFKIGAALGGILSAIVLVPLGLLMAFGVVNADEQSVMAGGMLFGFVTMICGPLIYALIYGILAAVNALIYNALAGLTGGLLVYLERPWHESNRSPVTPEQLGYGTSEQVW